MLWTIVVRKEGTRIKEMGYSGLHNISYNAYQVSGIRFVYATKTRMLERNQK